MSDADAEVWLGRLRDLKQGKAFGKPAPHKPLLLLLAIGRLLHDHNSRMTFEGIEQRLRGLLFEFGPPTAQLHPEKPFWHLQGDGLWSVSAADADAAGRKLSVDDFARTPTPAELRRLGAIGRLDPSFETALLRDRRFMRDAVLLLLDTNWTSGLHEDICEMVGLDVAVLEESVAAQRMPESLPPEHRHNPMFREWVLNAYSYRCAMCGYGGRLGAAAVGLAAAHVRWRKAGGPDSVDNGLCLCVIHRQLFDRGVLGVTADRRIMVSEQFRGWGRADHALVTALVGADVSAPRSKRDEVSEQHRRWHERTVFRGPPLSTGSVLR
ncbi:phosphorothioated DNA-binding restriction endonuclease [Candidatus Poriferisodalis sp.]|uniref:phosphorothioated DNA-binding restriction endonuclease n=1 Tax=Candidatus Poriferisodalis sp. TaxID=3101277 RepID=UPI003B01E8E1